MDKLWLSCEKEYLAPLRKKEETALREMEQQLLEGWDIDPVKARAAAVRENESIQVALCFFCVLCEGGWGKSGGENA